MIMGANPRTKGAGGEREIAKALDEIIQRVAKDHGYTLLNASVQRNSQQCGVGGPDLIGTFGLAIECKRVECLAIPQWWKQTVEQAARNNEIPVLIFRQSHQKWRVITEGAQLLYEHDATLLPFYCRVEISWADFLLWFEIYVQRKMSAGETART